jgi:hypothetical protein
MKTDYCIAFALHIMTKDDQQYGMEFDLPSEHELTLEFEVACGPKVEAGEEVKSQTFRSPRYYW